jgi:hypothetical protein
MPFNTLLLPLLGGFIFVNHWNPTRFDSRRYSGERLLLHSAIAGVIFLIIAFLIARGLMIGSPAMHAWWRSIVLVADLAMGTCQMLSDHSSRPYAGAFQG